jgi:hypothetical protein
MAEIDTSSYRLPTQPSALDTLGKLQTLKQQQQGIEQGQINIDTTKLDLVYKGIDYMTREINSLPPEATPQDIFKVLQNAVNQRFLTPEAYQQAIKEVPTSQAEIPAFKNRYNARAMEVRQALEFHAGQVGTISTGQTVQPIRTSPKPGFGIRSEGAPIQLQVPPTAQAIDPETGQSRFLGPQNPQLAPGTVSVPPTLPTARPPITTPSIPGPIKDPAILGPSANFGGNVLGAVVEPNSAAQQVKNRFPNMPRGPATGLPPGVAEAETAVATGSGAQFNRDLEKSASFQRDIFPLNEAIPALEKLGTKGTGPGTETLNQIKSFLLSNVPGIKESDLAEVKDFDKAKKYLTDFVNQTGSSGTNDKLAAAFAGNPSVGISNAAAVDVAKSALALRKMQQAVTQEYVKKYGTDASIINSARYSRWLAKRTNELDPRAFGVDMLSPEAKLKLRQQLDKDPKEAERFRKSYQLSKEVM